MTEAKLRKKYLEQELRDYLATREVTEKELHDLKAWVRNGNSVYDNAWYASGEDGWPLDYLTAERFMMEIVQSGEVFRKPAK